MLNFVLYPCLFSLVFVILNSRVVLAKKGKKKRSWIAPRPHIIMIVADDLV